MQKFQSATVEILSESEIVARLKCGDRPAFEELYRRYYDRLYRFALNFIRSNENAKDIVQDVFVKLWLNRDLLDPKQSIKAYLFMSTKNRALDFLKNNGNGNVNFGDDESEVYSYSDPVQEVIDSDFETAVREAIERLPQKCRLVFKLSRQEGLTYREIADLVGISENTVEKQIVRALKHLKKSLKSFLP